MRSACCSTSLCAPPKGSRIISSAIPNWCKSSAVIFIVSAAIFAKLLSFHKIPAAPSGEITEYVLFSNMSTRLAIPRPKAPPLPPSPMTMEITGTDNDAISIRLRAIDSLCPRSSAALPGYAPFVSINVKIGRPNFSACFISRKALRYPSG